MKQFIFGPSDQLVVEDLKLSLTMKPSNKPSSAELLKRANHSMNGLTDAEWNSRRLSGPITKHELQAFLRKTGQLPSEDNFKQAS
ncbi:hypothetical protein SAMN02745146_0741 [Hymenobacter daecheongensis DSM 21074]|uniref:Uncharacterized protein n=1 Tax=Hymenobacter daecheongensis DSM 21074 TaxID=1121955 RepID=A0A1M6ARN0_9BACT|nr:hypothetical protein [Hymenobacter daecheongensis]SHI39174.1 hypothetical protein SAMN02745146_0741 [Hymenobacter daecheongensis DSM 21074]